MSCAPEAAGKGLPRHIDACVQLMTFSRMTTVFETKRTVELMKYESGKFGKFYDGLHKLNRFKDLSPADFPVREVPRSSKSAKTQVYDPNDDSDGEVDDNFFKPLHS